MTPDQNKRGHKYIGLGIAIGTSVGVATGNIGLWLALGIAIGVAMSRRLNTGDDDED